MKPWLRKAFARSPHTKSTPAYHGNSPLIALQLAGNARWSGRDYASLAREGYQKNAIAYRCIRLIAEAAASVPFCVRRDGRCANNDPVAKLLQRPNLKISRAEFFETHYGYLQLGGNAYLEAALEYEKPISLYCLRPDRMQATIGRDGWPSGWEYCVDGKTRLFSIDVLSGRSPIHHMQLFHPTNDVYGFSPLEAAAQAVDIHNAGSAWTKSLLDNSARPSGALVYGAKGGENRLSDEQFIRLKTELESSHAGARAAGRPLLLEGGLDWKPMSLSPADMDFLNAKREAAREIALAFGVPPMLLGIPGDNTYANYKEANLAFWRQTVLPLVNKTADSLSAWFEPWFGEGLSIHPELEAVPVLGAERVTNWKNLQEISFLSEAEKREIAGFSVLEPKS